MLEDFFIGVLATGGFERIMNTLLASLALEGLVSAPSWQTSYTEAQQRAAAQKKPIAVVFAPGPFALSKVVRDSSPAPDISKLLTEQYVCVFVDTETDAGRKVASDFA